MFFTFVILNSLFLWSQGVTYIGLEVLMLLAYVWLERWVNKLLAIYWPRSLGAYFWIISWPVYYCGIIMSGVALTIHSDRIIVGESVTVFLPFPSFPLCICPIFFFFSKSGTWWEPKAFLGGEGGLGLKINMAPALVGTLSLMDCLDLLSYYSERFVRDFRISVTVSQPADSSHSHLYKGLLDIVGFQGKMSYLGLCGFLEIAISLSLSLLFNCFLYISCWF
jgi:hypothetical protein